MTRLYIALRAHPTAPDPDTPEWREAHPNATMDDFGEASLAYHAAVQDRCARCGRPHDRLWTVDRRPAGVWGHWPLFRLNGHTVPIDRGLPHLVSRLPRDARPVDPRAAAAWWHNG